MHFCETLFIASTYPNVVSEDKFFVLDRLIELLLILMQNYLI